MRNPVTAGRGGPGVAQWAGNRFARPVSLMEQGQGHPMMAGRETGYSVPCTYRDEVATLPQGAKLIAGARSIIRSFLQLL